MSVPEGTDLICNAASVVESMSWPAQVVGLTALCAALKCVDPCLYRL